VGKKRWLMEDGRWKMLSETIFVFDEEDRKMLRNAKSALAEKMENV
jgi:hypothetical protein